MIDTSFADLFLWFLLGCFSFMFPLLIIFQALIMFGQFFIGKGPTPPSRV